MAGYIYSKRQEGIFRFLERVGPCPLEALEILFGRKTLKALYSLRRAGYVYDIVLNGTRFWSPQGYGRFDPAGQEAMAWFIVRLEEKRGEYLGDGLCVTPNGTRLTLYPGDGFVQAADEKRRRMIARTDDLKIKTLGECLRWEKESG